MMRACVFVDGENFRYSIGGVFPAEKISRKRYLPKTARWGEFFDDIVRRGSNGEARRVRAYWYVNAHVDFWPPVPTAQQERNERAKIEAWLVQNSRYIGLSGIPEEDVVRTFRQRKADFAEEFDGLRKVQRRIERDYTAIEFRRSGAISYKLYKDPEKARGKEKTVDVNLAVDMLQMRDTYDIAIIVSGDQDYLPAVQAIKDAGKTVINVAFAKKCGDLLPGGAVRLNEAADRPLIIDYPTFAHFLGLPAETDEEK